MDLLFSSAITLSSLGGIVYLKGILNSKASFMNRLLEMPVVSPQELIDKL
jgi:hypothetical protein